MQRTAMILALNLAMITVAQAKAAQPNTALSGLPSTIHFGASLADTRGALAAVCPKLTVRRIDPPFLDVIKDRQMQIDCDGLAFAGQPRHAEFVIGDDRLGMIWIMVKPEEEDAVVEMLAKTYGLPERPNSQFWTFPGRMVAFRRDKSEVLYFGAERAVDVMPDFRPLKSPAPFSFADYIAGRDPAVDAILSGREMRSLVEIARTAGTAAAKQAFEDRRARFAQLSWWAPADREDLNRLGNDLRRAGKHSEAVAVLALNTEIFPEWWNSWDSLGEAQLAAGQKKAGLASYAKALELNPGDGFAQQAIAEAGVAK